MAVTSIDLTDPSSSATVNGAIFRIPGTATSGSGLIDPFVRIQNTSGNTESGYNTSNYTTPGSLGPLDMKAGTFTHDLLLSDIFTNIVTVGGVTYYEFVLEINENGTNNNLLSLDRLEFFVGPNSTNTQSAACHGPPNSGNNSNTAYVPDPSQPGPGTLCGLTAVYSLDVGTLDQTGWTAYSGPGTGPVQDPLDDYSIKLDDTTFPAGNLDLVVLVPTALFGPPNTNQKVYLYSKFGELQSSNATHEEWAHKLEGTFVPIPGTAFLFGAGLLVMGALRRRTRA